MDDLARDRPGGQKKGLVNRDQALEKICGNLTHTGERHTLPASPPWLVSTSAEAGAVTLPGGRPSTLFNSQYSLIAEKSLRKTRGSVKRKIPRCI